MLPRFRLCCFTAVACSKRLRAIITTYTRRENMKIKRTFFGFVGKHEKNKIPEKEEIRNINTLSLANSKLSQF